MVKKKKEKKNSVKITRWTVMALVGFLMILFSAANYVFGWKYSGISAISILGLVFVAIATANSRKEKKKGN